MKSSRATRYFNNFWLFVAISTIAMLSVSCSQHSPAHDTRTSANSPQLLMGSTFTGNGFIALPASKVAEPAK